MTMKQSKTDRMATIVASMNKANIAMGKAINQLAEELTKKNVKTTPKTTRKPKAVRKSKAPSEVRFYENAPDVGDDNFGYVFDIEKRNFKRSYVVGQKDKEVDIFWSPDWRIESIRGEATGTTLRTLSRKNVDKFAKANHEKILVQFVNGRGETETDRFDHMRVC